MRAWRGWIALGAVLVLAGAAAVALVLAPDEQQPSRDARGDLKLERQLQVPRASSPGTAVR